MLNEKQVFEIIKDVITEVMPDIDQAQILANNKFTDLGANSVDKIEVVAMSMEKLEVAIPLTKFANIGSIGDLVRVFFEEVSEAESVAN